MVQIPVPAAVRDGLAGLGVAGLMVPEAVAYAGIAGLGPGRALVAAVAGGLVYCVLGGSRLAIVSPTSSSAAILAASLGSLGVGAGSVDGAATALTLCVGGLLVGFAVFRLGGLAAFVSRPVLRGFAFGLAISIIARQLPALTGVPVTHHGLWGLLGDLLRQHGAWHWSSLGLGALALALLTGLRRFPGVPGTLLVMAGGVALALLCDLPGWGIALAGPAPLALPALDLPGDFAIWARLVQWAVPLALMVFAESWGTVRTLALDQNDPLLPNRELRALGLANCLAGAVQGMPVGAGFSAGMASRGAGATSRRAALVASLAVLGLALFAQDLIARIPQPVLAAVVISALTHALAPAPLLRLFRLGRDQWIGVGAALGVLALGVLNGMLAAIALSLGELLYRLSHPSLSTLGRVGTTHDFVDLARHSEAQAVAGLLIVRPNAPLFFANAETVLGTVRRAATGHGVGTVVLSLEESDDLDSTALEALAEFAASLGKAGQHLLLARAHDRVREVLAAAGLADLARNSTFSVADAVARATEEA
ncbi:MAG TPA: SulP family inorganic anion transporter [Novosphingobium sp.]